jgi:hypothetical protein
MSGLPARTENRDVIQWVVHGRINLGAKKKKPRDNHIAPIIAENADAL